MLINRIRQKKRSGKIPNSAQKGPLFFLKCRRNGVEKFADFGARKSGTWAQKNGPFFRKRRTDFGGKFIDSEDLCGMGCFQRYAVSHFGPRPPCHLSIFFLHFLHFFFPSVFLIRQSTYAAIRPLPRPRLLGRPDAHEQSDRFAPLCRDSHTNVGGDSTSTKPAEILDEMRPTTNETRSP